jgi:zinc protease
MRRILARSIVSLAIAAAWLAPAASQPASQPASQAAFDPDAAIPTGPGVKVGKLSNGLTYYIRQNKVPARRLELRLVVKAGSILEDEDQRGLAHFTEHMAFNGSTHFRKHEVVGWLQSIGVKFGADLNAFTSYDQTMYVLPVPTDKQENVDKAFTILEDWAHGVAFNEADIDKERSVVLEELRTRKGVGERLDKVLMPKLFNGSRYADRSIGGTDESIRGFKYDALRRFYRDWYRPDLMAVVAVGDIEPEELERQIRRHFEPLTNPAAPRPRDYVEITPLAATEALAVTDRELPMNTVSLHYPVSYAPDRGTYGSYRERLLERLVGGMLAQRLAEVGQQPNPPFVAASSGLAQMTPRYRGYTARVVLGAGGSAPALAALLQEQQRARRHGFGEAEFDRARKTMQRSHERSYNERNGTTSGAYVAEYIRNFTANEPLPGSEAEHRIVQEMLPAITLDEVNAFARRMIPGDDRKLVIYVGGEAAPAPAPAQLLLEVAAGEKAVVGAHEEKAVASRLMAPPATPGTIVAETVDKSLGITRLTFSNGVKAILKPTNFQQDQVLLGARRFGGQHLFDEKDLANARHASALVAAMGLKDFSPLELRKMLAGRNANAGVQLGADTDDIGGAAGSTPDEIEAMLQMLWLRFDGVRRDEGLYKSYLAKEEEVLRHRDATPQARFGDALVDTLYAGHPYEPRATVLADLPKVDLDRSIALYRQRFSSAKGFTFVLAGKFDVDKIKPLLATYLGTLPVPDLPVAYRDVGLRYASGVVKREVKAGTEPKSTLSLSFTGPAVWSPDEQQRIDALVEIMNLRIVEVLREKLGLIYGGRMSGGIVRTPWEHYVIATALPTGPDQVERMRAALFAEIERLKKEGPDPADLDKVKQNWSQSWQRNMRSNAYWLSVLGNAELYGSDPHRILDQLQRAGNITPEDVKLAAQRYFNTGNYVQVVLNPEDAKPALAGAATPR